MIIASRLLLLYCDPHVFESSLCVIFVFHLFFLVQGFARGDMSLHQFIENFQYPSYTQLAAAKATEPEARADRSEHCTECDEGEVSPRLDEMADRPHGSLIEEEHVNLRRALPVENEVVEDIVEAMMERLDSSSSSEADEIPQQAWEVVRDALLAWPGEERNLVQKYRWLIHGSWVRMWLNACHNDMAVTIKGMLSHFLWRQVCSLVLIC